MKLKLLITLIAFSFLSVGIANASSPVECVLPYNAEVTQSTDTNGNPVYTFRSFKPWTLGQFNQLQSRGMFTGEGLLAISYDENKHEIAATFTPEAVSESNYDAMLRFFNNCGFDDFTIMN